MRFYNPNLLPPQSTFVPDGTPWDMILKAGASKQKDWDETEAAMATVPGLLKANIRKTFTDSRGNVVLNPDWDAFNKKEKEIKDKLDALSGADLTDPTVKREIFKIKNDISNWTNTYGKTAEATSKAYESTYDEWRKADRTDDSQGRALGLDQFVHGYKGAHTQEYAGSPIGKYVELDKIVNNYGQNINSELLDLRAGYQDAKTKGGIKGIEEWKRKNEGILASKVDQTIVQPAWNDYKYVASKKIQEEAYWRARNNGTDPSEELNREVEVETKGKDGKPVKIKMSYFDKRMTEEFENLRGNARKFVKSTGDLDVNFTTLDKDLQGKSVDLAGGYYPGAAIATNNPMTKIKDEFSFDAAGGERVVTVGVTSTGVPITQKAKSGASKKPLSENAKKLAIKTLKTLAAGEKDYNRRKDMYQAALMMEKGYEMSDEQKKNYYPLLQEQADMLSQRPEMSLTNLHVIPLDKEEAKMYNRQFFGDEQGKTLKQTGTAFSAGSVFLTEDGEEKTWEEIKKEHGEEDFVSIQGKPSAKNTLNLLGGKGKQDYSNAIQVSIGGKRYFTSDMQFSPGTPQYSVQEDNKFINAAFSVAISQLDDEIPVHTIKENGKNVSIKVLMEPIAGDNENIKVTLVKGDNNTPLTTPVNTVINDISLTTSELLKPFLKK